MSGNEALPPALADRRAPVLARTVARLDEKAIEWRLRKLCERPQGSAHALVDVPEHQRDAAAEALLGAGFVRLRPLSEEDGAFLIYEQGLDTWLIVRLGEAPGPDSSATALTARRPLGKGCDVCLLAPDGAGKSTLVADLAEHLPFPVWTEHMELYGRQRSGPAVPGVRLAARVLRQQRRWLRARWRARHGALVLYDRYPYDALLTGGRPMGTADRLRRGLLAHVVPPPARAIILDVPADVLHARKAEREISDLDRLRREYRALASRLPCPAVVVDAGGELRDVRRAVTEELWRALREQEQH